MSQTPIEKFFDFSGKTVIVTGGANGIGYGIALRFIEARANVVIADLAANSREKTKSLGSRAHFIKTDVSSERDVKKLMAETKKLFGGLDVLINNAGIFPGALVSDMTLDFWEKTMAVNLRGVFLCCREAMKILPQGSAIINIGSIDSLHPSRASLAAYDATKHGVWGFTKNLALELAHQKIRVNCIAPGGVDTEGVRGDMGKFFKSQKDQDKVLQEFVNGVPLKRLGVPDDIAMSALFLASPAASYITGSILVIDGGELLT